MSGRDLGTSWAAAFPPHTIGGSLYAVPAEQRAAVAADLAAHAYRVHADVIVDATGAHRGVTWDQLEQVRLAAPDARLDLHLILAPELTDQAQGEVVQAAVKAAMNLRVEAVTVGARPLDRHRVLLEAARAQGAQLWLELAPGAAKAALPLGFDGVTIMFIPPGTTERADPRIVNDVARLSRSVRVAVDGGITKEIAEQCLTNGADYIVAGRSLLTTTSTNKHARSQGRVSP